jgi:hypothetical protein
MLIIPELQQDSQVPKVKIACKGAFLILISIETESSRGVSTMLSSSVSLFLSSSCRFGRLFQESIKRSPDSCRRGRGPKVRRAPEKPYNKCGVTGAQISNITEHIKETQETKGENYWWRDRRSTLD